MIYEKIGFVIDVYFLVIKVCWILDYVFGV